MRTLTVLDRARRAVCRSNEIDGTGRLAPLGPA
jgi:hypothetical protein